VRQGSVSQRATGARQISGQNDSVTRPEPIFRGVGVALVTIFDDDRAVDLGATADHARRLVAAGVSAVVVAGSTGEAETLDDDERVALVRTIRDALAPDVPVLAGTGGPWGRTAARRTAAAAQAGADGVLVLSPRRVDDPRPYYEAVAVAADGLPVLAYHFPSVSPPGIPVPLLAELPIDGVKDSTGEPQRLLETLDAFAGWIYVGSSALLSFAGPLGATGAILAAANLEPALTIKAFTGDADAQRALLPAHLAASRDFPRGLKVALAEQSGTSPVARQ
jgi:4-hydroxy-tetrahydrodipicolinate synthase